jgi:hypothetical protein
VPVARPADAGIGSAAPTTPSAKRGRSVVERGIATGSEKVRWLPAGHSTGPPKRRSRGLTASTGRRPASAGGRGARGGFLSAVAPVASALSFCRLVEFCKKLAQSFLRSHLLGNFTII